MFGQYTAEDIYLSPGGNVWAGSIYAAPQAVVGTNPQATGITNSLLPALTNIVAGITPAVSSYFQYSAQKEAAKSGVSLKQAGAKAPMYQRPTTLPTTIAGLPVSTWMLVGGGSLAAILLLRKRRGPVGRTRGRR